jgi:hypothetical protein
MPTSVTAIEPGDRKFLIAAGALFLGVTLAAALAPPEEKGPQLASSYSPASRGAKAAYTLLAELGYPIERWSRPPADLPARPAGVVLVLADSLLPPSAEDRVDLVNFVRRGGRVLVTGAEGAAIFGEQHLLPRLKTVGEWQRFKAELPAPVTAGAPEIAMASSVRWPPTLAKQQGYFGDRDGETVIGYALGPGEVIWWASASPLTNYGLSQASNLPLLFNSLGVSGAPVGRHGVRPARILWDEYFHGDRLSLSSYLGRTPVPWALLQGALVLAAALATFGRRYGPLRPMQVKSRLSPLEFVEALGDLYQRQGAASGALETAYRRFRIRFTQRLGMPASASAAALFKASRGRLGWTVPGFWETLQRCERGVRNADLSDSEALHLVRELHDYARRLKL